jgi:hypothetical protein
MCRWLLALLLASVLAGCSTVDNKLSPEQVGSFRLAAVNVRFADDVPVIWPDEARSFAEAKGVDAGSADAQAHVKSTIASKIRTMMQRRLGDRLVGSRPVRFEVLVKKFQIPTTFVLVAGSGYHTFTAQVDLVDAKSGETLATNPEVHGFVAPSPGVVGALVDTALFEGPAERLIDSFGLQYRMWLLRSP